MAKYRIHIENLEGGDFVGKGPIELNDFVLFGEDDEQSSHVVIHGISLAGIAYHIAADDTLLPAAVKARAIYEAQKIAEDMKEQNSFEKLMGGLWK